MAPRTARRTSLVAAAALALSSASQPKQVWALPQSKVAFAQHGLAEGEDAVMHAPSDVVQSARLSPMTPQLLSSAIARVMSLDARAEVGTGLPAGDIFNRPDANVLVFVDGLRSAGAESTPFMKEWLQEPMAAYGLHTPTDDAWMSGLESALGASFDVVDSVGTVVCASVDLALGYTEACSTVDDMLAPAEGDVAAVSQAAQEGSLVGVTADTSSGLTLLVLSGAKEGEEDAAVLDLTVDADARLVKELSFLASLPKALEQRLPAGQEGSSPPLVILYLSSLKAINTEYGARSTKAALASKALDASLGVAFDAMAAGAGRRLTSQLIVGPSLSQKLAVGARRLQSDDDDATSSSNVTLEDITQFQINMWAGVGLALLGFLAIYATFTMDVQPDSLLYAKFITDTSGSGLKTD